MKPFLEFALESVVSQDMFKIEHILFLGESNYVYILKKK